MKKLLLTLICVIGMITVSKSQCNSYEIYESFSSVLPSYPSTWTANSMLASTTVKTGTHSIGFNGAGDWIATPQIATPGVLSFWYRRSTNTTAWTLNVQTSPDGTTWTTRGTVTSPTTTYQQYSLNLGTLGLTNVYIRLLDGRGSGAHERYVDDFSLTSTGTSLLLPIVGACSQTLNSSLVYTITDDCGPQGPTLGGYSNSVDRTITLTPSDNTKKLQLDFSHLDLETNYDYLYIYDGPNTSSTLLATLNGTTTPNSIVASNASGQLTIRWTTDVSNIGTWGGFRMTATSITVCTTPTNGGTLTSNKTLTTANDIISLTTTGNEGNITLIEWSYDNFSTVAGSQSNPANPYSIRLNVQQTSVSFRTTSKNGSCPDGLSNVKTISLRNAPIYTTGIDDGDYISNVTLNNINNSSTNDGDAYQDFTSQVIELTKGEPYMIYVTATNTFQSGQGYAAWIDWNGNGTFETSELVLQKAPANSTSQLIDVPADAVTGDVLMRVLSAWGTTPNSDAYYSTGYGYGEIEEYTIRLSNPITLPVVLTQFEGVPYPQWNVIKWTTASEQNSDYFSLESSVDGETWREIAKRPAAGNSTEEIKYSWIDYTQKELTYYRLIQYDIDGKYKIYNPIVVSKTINKTIVKYVNLMGQEVNPLTTIGLVIEVYSDGSTKKLIR